MKTLIAIVVTVSTNIVALAADEPPKPFVTGLKHPRAAVTGTDGRIYVAEIVEQDKDGTGRIVVIQDGKAVPFAEGLSRPSAMVAFQGWLFVADSKQVWRIDKNGKVGEFAPAKAFPVEPKALTGITVDETGTFYVADFGTPEKPGAIFRIDPKGKVTLVADAKKNSDLDGTAGLAMDGMSHLLLARTLGPELDRLKLADRTLQKVAETIGDIDSVVWDHYGRLYISTALDGNLHVLPRPGDKPVLLASGFKSIGYIGLDPTGKYILVPDYKAGTLTKIPAKVPGQEVDDSPLPIETAVAFPDLQWTGWKAESSGGKAVNLRPLVLTHAGDGSNRVFVATQHGVIHVFPNDQKATKTQIFLDIQDRVSYDDKQNEEGFLGLTFHPNYKKNGQFFVFYTSKKAKLTNIISRFKVSKDDPNKADPDSEEVLLRIEKPYWNHDGGTLCFGPDGYLYFTHGDGGAGNDPHGNGQKLSTLLGKILRIDVDHTDEGLPYAIPRGKNGNPFDPDKKDVRGEIWAYGLRNVWRMSFDRKTGQLWAADVGQNLYEEIDLIEKGGNYGWSLREGLHPFGAGGVDVRKDLIEPIWEYSHDVGKCIIGGHVYRGERLPELDGHYLYADYVVPHLWALRYDEDKHRVVANRTIKPHGIPVLSFGEDEKGEVYLLSETATGKGIYWLVRSKDKSKE